MASNHYTFSMSNIVLNISYSSIIVLFIQLNVMEYKHFIIKNACVPF